MLLHAASLLSGDSGSLLESHATKLARELATPVSLKTITVFKVDNFGTQLAPFYDALGFFQSTLVLSFREAGKALVSTKRLM